MKISKFVYLSLILIPFSIYSCLKAPSAEPSTTTTTTNPNPTPTPTSVDPGNPNALQSVITIPGGTLTPGNIPNSTAQFQDSTQLYISNAPSTVAVNPGSQLIVPFQYTSTNGYNNVYVQVDGATNGYFNVPITTPPPLTGTTAIPINIPSTVKTGNFCLRYCIRNAAGKYVGGRICVTIEPPLVCIPGSSISKSGSEGLTFTDITMGNNPAAIKIRYNTYTAVDRIDVYQGTSWITGTGPNPGSIIPPVASCDFPKPGFVGKIDTLMFNYNPTNGKQIRVTVSGCIGNSTAWDWSLICP